MKSGHTTTIQSVDRAIMVLRCFDRGEKLGITEISRRLGLHKSTAFGLVNTLAENKLLEQDPETGRYFLGIGLFRLSANVQIGIRELGAPFVKRLVEHTGETVNLVVRDESYVVYIEKLESPHSMRICTRIGQRLPMYCTAVGKAMLAWLPPEEAAAILDSARMTAYTENTITTRAALRTELQKIRDDGYAIDDEELELGLVCVAVPIRDAAGRPVAALSVSGPKQRMTSEHIEAIRKALTSEAAAMSRELR
ncbi:MAG: IclR family transcriptional regulator [Clostridia bacterium]|nr:IclR family transcriptional regulator [Clostridia bacterium]